jgi:hypothetical protein
MQIDPDGVAKVYKSIDSGSIWPNSEKILTSSAVGFEGIVKFTCGFHPSTNVLYLRGYINATDFYQLNCEPTRLLFGKQINGQWYGMWKK